MAVKKISLPMQMALGMILGILVGFAAPYIGLEAGWFRPFGQLFINGIRMVVVPLVMSTLIAGAASVSDISKLGRVAVKTLLYFCITTVIATTLGLIFAGVIHPGLGLSIPTEGLVAKQVEPPTMVQVLMDIVPINPVASMSNGSMLQIIFFSIMLGICLSLVGEKGKAVTDFFNSLAEVMIKMTGIVMLYAPIGVFALMAFTVASQGSAVLLPLLKLCGVMYITAIVYILIVYFPLLKYSGISPRQYVKVASEPLMTAFTTCSSAAALSSNLVASEKLGASKTISSFAIPLGNTINMAGTAIYMGVATIFAAEIFNIPMPLSRQITIVFMALLAAIGTIGVPGAGMIMISIIFTQVGIPLEAVAIVAGVDRILDMARTTLNVMGDSTAAIVVSKLEGDLHPGVDESNY